MIAFNKEYYDEKIESLEKELIDVWKRINTIDNRFYAVIILLVFNLGGMLVNIVISYGKLFVKG